MQGDAETVIWSYLVYLALSVGVTLWVGRTLYKNGRVFLVDIFHGNALLADSVNHLLVVGFYLINIGFVALALKEEIKPRNAQQAIEFLSTKEGWVLLVLGGMHFFNLAILAKLRNREELQKQLGKSLA